MANDGGPFWSRIARSEQTLLIGLGVVIGIVTAYGAIFCRWGIDVIRRLAFGSAGDITDLASAAGTPWWLVLLLPAAGGGWWPPWCCAGRPRRAVTAFPR